MAFKSKPRFVSSRRRFLCFFLGRHYPLRSLAISTTVFCALVATASFIGAILYLGVQENFGIQFSHSLVFDALLSLFPFIFYFITLDLCLTQNHIRFSETKGMQVLGIGMRRQRLSFMQLVSADYPDGGLLPLEPPPPFALALRPNWTRYGRVRYGDAFERRTNAAPLGPSLSPIHSSEHQSGNGGAGESPPASGAAPSVSGARAQSQSATDASPPDPCLQQFLTSKLSPHNYSVLITALAQLHFTLTSAGIQPIVFMGSLLGSWRHHDIIPVHSR